MTKTENAPCAKDDASLKTARVSLSGKLKVAETALVTSCAFAFAFASALVLMSVRTSVVYRGSDTL